jgi:hypothetical protein
MSNPRVSYGGIFEMDMGKDENETEGESHGEAAMSMSTDGDENENNGGNDDGKPMMKVILMPTMTTVMMAMLSDLLGNGDEEKTRGDDDVNSNADKDVVPLSSVCAICPTVRP